MHICIYVIIVPWANVQRMLVQPSDKTALDACSSKSPVAAKLALVPDSFSSTNSMASHTRHCAHSWVVDNYFYLFGAC